MAAQQAPADRSEPSSVERTGNADNYAEASSKDKKAKKVIADGVTPIGKKSPDKNHEIFRVMGFSDENIRYISEMLAQHYGTDPSPLSNENVQSLCRNLRDAGLDQDQIAQVVAKMCGMKDHIAVMRNVSYIAELAGRLTNDRSYSPEEGPALVEFLNVALGYMEKNYDARDMVDSKAHKAFFDVLGPMFLNGVTSKADFEGVMDLFYSVAPLERPIVAGLIKLGAKNADEINRSLRTIRTVYDDADAGLTPEWIDMYLQWVYKESGGRRVGPDAIALCFSDKASVRNRTLILRSLLAQGETDEKVMLDALQKGVNSDGAFTDAGREIADRFNASRPNIVQPERKVTVPDGLAGSLSRLGYRPEECPALLKRINVERFCSATGAVPQEYVNYLETAIEFAERSGIKDRKKIEEIMAEFIDMPFKGKVDFAQVERRYGKLSGLYEKLGPRGYIQTVLLLSKSLNQNSDMTLAEVLDLCQRVKEKNGIEFLGRYSINTLRGIDEPCGDRTAVVIANKGDESGAFYDVGQKVATLQNAGYKVIVVETDTENDVYRTIDSLPEGSIDLLVVAAHGSREFSGLGGGYGEEHQIGLEDKYEWIERSSKFAVNAKIFFVSCSTGKGEVGFDNIASSFFDWIDVEGLEVYAPLVDTNADINISKDGEPTIGYYTDKVLILKR